MINRLKPWFEEPEERPPASEYFRIESEARDYYVRSDEARRVAQLLERRWPPRWIRITDIFGAEVRLPARSITAICESTEAVRRHEREFRRARRTEDREDRRPWEDDEWW